VGWGLGEVQVCNVTLHTSGRGWGGGAVVLLYINGFEAGNSITRGIGRGGPRNLDFFGPKWHSLRL
jgi:hypothetical protein